MFGRNQAPAHTRWSPPSASACGAQWQIHAAADQFHARERQAEETRRLEAAQKLGKHLKTNTFQHHLPVPKMEKHMLSLHFFKVEKLAHVRLASCCGCMLLSKDRAFGISKKHYLMILILILFIYTYFIHLFLVFFL